MAVVVVSGERVPDAVLASASVVACHIESNTAHNYDTVLDIGFNVPYIYLGDHDAIVSDTRYLFCDKEASALPFGQLPIEFGLRRFA